MRTIEYFDVNTTGEDYVVGDIHGCFTKLHQELDRIGFNYTTDRLFAVGDLVDRGPQSDLALEWLNYPWFHTVAGNHEQMAIDYYTGYGMDTYTYEYNGGNWFIKRSKDQQKLFAEAFEQLPLMIEIKTINGAVGLVHAEVPNDDWGTAKEWLVKQPTAAANVLMWARDRIRYHDKTKVEGIDQVIVGHTPLKHITNLGNVMYIDTGACFGGHLTIISLRDMQEVT